MKVQPSSSRPAEGCPAFVADQRDLALFHFAIEPAMLAPRVPYPVLRHGKSAYVSLIAFRLEHLRPARWPVFLGRWLLRPFSNYQCLDLCTYVDGPAGPGVHFITGWIDNPRARRLDPAFRGLPCRLASICRASPAGSGLQRIDVQDRATGRVARLIAPVHRENHAPEYGRTPRDGFLLEHRLAYTHHHARACCFGFEHHAWDATPFHLARFDAGLFEHLYPWFRHVQFVGGHLVPGCTEMTVSRPQRLVAAESEPERGAFPERSAAGLAGAAPHAIPCRQI